MAAVVVLALLVVLAFLLAGAVMEFVFVESLRTRTVHIRRYWGEHWRKGVGLVGAWLAPSPLLVGAAVLVYGAGVGLPLPSIDAAVSRLVPASFRGGALSLRNSMTFLGRALGPVVFAGVAATTGYHALLLAGGIGSLGIGLLMVVLARKHTGTAEVDPRIA